MVSPVIVPFRPDLAPAFTRLNRAWIEDLFALEEADWKVLRDPAAAIVVPGGQIFFALDEQTPIGTAAALRVSSHRYELAKMAVDPHYQGRGIGQRLGEAAIQFARDRGANTVFLLTNSRLGGAIRLYERLGFTHQPLPPNTEYSRADVYMELGLDARSVMPQTLNFTIRRAERADVDAIAAAHLDSIRSIGPQYYDAAIVSDWGARVKGDLYVNAMARGEVFYIAIGESGGTPEVLGFSSHRIDENEHHVAVYVRGTAARHGVGSALLRSAEAAAIAARATSIHLDASLAAVEFYKVNGFEDVGRGEHRLWSGRPMACVFMRKTLDVARCPKGS